MPPSPTPASSSSSASSSSAPLFSPSSFLSFFDFPVATASSITSPSAPSSSSSSSIAHPVIATSLFDVSCLQPDPTSPPVVTSPPSPAAPHSHFFPPSSSAPSLTSSTSSPSLRQSLPAATTNTTPFFELSNLTSWIDSLFRDGDADGEKADQKPSQREDERSRQGKDANHVKDSNDGQDRGKERKAISQPRSCRPRTSALSTSPAPTKAPARPRRKSAVKEQPQDDEHSSSPSPSSSPHTVQSASSPMSIARTSPLPIPARPVLSGAGSPVKPAAVDVDEITKLLGSSVPIRAAGALSPLPEVQLVEALTPDSPSHPIRLTVMRETSTVRAQAETTTPESPVSVFPPPAATASLPPSSLPVASPTRPHPHPPPLPPLPSTLLSSALSSADLDYFSFDQSMIVVDAPDAPSSPLSDPDTEELSWDESSTIEVVELHSRHEPRPRREDDEDWEVCKVTEQSEEEYEML